MISVDEINIGMAGWPEQHGRAGGVSGGGVRRGIFCTQVGFDFDDAGGAPRLRDLPDQHLT